MIITGHSGFKGGWLSLWLQKMQASVFGLSLDSPTNPALFYEANVAKNMRAYEGDVRDYSTVLRVFTEVRPEIVFHLAAQPLVRESYARPIDTYATNVMGTVHVLEAARQTEGVKAIVNVTTDKCYENKEWVWGYREDEPMGGYDPYSSSKGCSEILTSAYRRSFFAHGNVAVATARAGNVIGGGDWSADRLVPDIISSFRMGQVARIRNPEAIRPWQHVLEPVSGYLLLAQKLFLDGQRFAQAWNFGPEHHDSRSVRYLANKIADRWGPEAKWKHLVEESPHEAKLLSLDISKAKKELCWKPKMNTDDAVELTVDWYRRWVERHDMREVTLKQIAEYEARESGTQTPLQ